MGETMTAQLPAGWTVDEPEEKEQGSLPPGWSVQEDSTPQQRDRAKINDKLGVLAASEKTPEEVRAMSLPEKLEYVQELQREQDLLKSHAFVTGTASGATFGLTKNIEDLKPMQFEDFAPYSFYNASGEIVGSYIPLSRLMKVFAGPAMGLASKSPILQRQLGSLGTMFGVGVADQGLRTLAKGEIPSADDLLEHGLEWAALDAALQTVGTIGRFAKGLLGFGGGPGGRKQVINDIYKDIVKSGTDMTNPQEVSDRAFEALNLRLLNAERIAERQEARGVSNFAEEIINKPPEQITPKEPKASKPNPLANRVLNQIEITPKDLKTRKVSDESINKLSSETHLLSEPYIRKDYNFEKEAEALEQNVIRDKIESVGIRAATEEELGTNIRENIETRLEEAKAEYRPLYTDAEKVAETTLHVPQNTAREASAKLMRISRLKTKPAGYANTITNLENVLTDAGFVVQRTPEGAIELIVSANPVPVSDTIELARRLNEIIDYEAIEPTVKDVLKSVKRAAKEDIRIGLEANPDGLAAFELAEEAHARTAEKFTKQSIRKIRGQEAGEKISKMAEAPSSMGELKEVLSPEQYTQLEREMLEKLNNQSYEGAQKTLRQIENHMSAENKKLARDIVEYKNPHNPEQKKKILKDSIITEVSDALTKGTRPGKTLELWKQSRGHNLIKDAFKNSPNWPKVKSYLEKQSFNDMVASVIKDGKIDFKKYKQYVKDPVILNAVRMQGGPEAVDFFVHLDSQVKQLENNVKLLDRFPTELEIKKGKELVERRVREAQEIRGKELIKVQKEKNIAEKQRLLEEQKDKNRPFVKIIKKNQPEATRGKEKLDQLKQKVEKKQGRITDISKNKLGTKKEPGEAARIKKESTGERGKGILKELVKKDFPIQSKAKKWRAWFTETMSMNEKGVISVFGLMKLGLPNTVALLIAYRILNKMLSSSKVRSAFIEAAKQQTNPLKFILSIEKLGETLEEEKE